MGRKPAILKDSLIGFLKAADRGLLPNGWLFLEGRPIRPQTRCILIDDPDCEIEDLEGYAAKLGYPVDGLPVPEFEDIVRGARRLSVRATHAQLARAFQYYLEFDAFPETLDAPDPPANDDALERSFYDSLGPERPESPCRKEGCTRGAISLSIFCRPHHFESVMRLPCPFTD